MIDHTYGGELPANQQEVFHYLHDALGSVVGLTRDSGSLVERYTYDPYGKTFIEKLDGSGDWIATNVSSLGNPFAWTGQRYDASTEIYQFLARAYSVAAGRWLQRDPMEYVDGINLYQMVGSAPTVYVDPFGYLAGF